VTGAGTANASAPIEPTPKQRAQERSMVFAISADAGMIVLVSLAGIVGGSLTMLAELLRGVLGYVLECFTLVVLRRIHRGRLADMEYGAGKIEQVANAVIATSMLLASAWLALSVWRIWAGERELGSPLGLAYAAIVGFLNVYVNVLAWDGVRRSMTADASLIMDAQLELRRVKLVASVFVAFTLTISALSTDDVVVAWGESAGSLFVAGYMVVSATEILRSAMPDLLDRSAGTGVRIAAMRVLDAHAGAYERLLRMRTRRSGRATFIEIHLAFDPMLKLSDVERRIETLRAAIGAELSAADVTIVPGSISAALPA
jgi:ferrous-iron efflux pump FieF